VNAPDNPFLGNPQLNREALSYNAGYDISPNLSLYSFATFGHRNGESYQNYRTPSTLPEIFPTGFVPQIAINSNDYSFTGGIKGNLPDGWSWDLSTTYGGESDDIDIFDTVNTSLYEATGHTPTRFFNMFLPVCSISTTPTKSARALRMRITAADPRRKMGYRRSATAIPAAISPPPISTPQAT
jgi:hypothetical protein